MSSGVGRIARLSGKYEKTLWVRVSTTQKNFAENEWGRGWMSEQVRHLIDGAIAQNGTEKEKILKQLQVWELEGNSLRQRLKDLNEVEAQKEKEEHELNTKREEAVNMLVNASRRHAKVSPMLWQTATERSGIPITELRKLVKEKLKESELHEN